MSNQLFQQNLDDKKGPQPGGPYLIQMLFKEPVDMPDKETMTAVIEKHIGSTECFCYDINTPEHIILEQMKKEALYQAISALPAADQALVQGLFFKGQSELDYPQKVSWLRSRFDDFRISHSLPETDPTERRTHNTPCLPYPHSH